MMVRHILQIKAHPSAKKNRAVLKEDGLLHIYVIAAPENNKANKAIIKKMSKALKISQQSIAMVSGHTSATKKLEMNLKGIRLSDAIQQIVENFK